MNKQLASKLVGLVKEQIIIYLSFLPLLVLLLLYHKFIINFRLVVHVIYHTNYHMLKLANENTVLVVIVNSNKKPICMCYEK